MTPLVLLYLLAQPDLVDLRGTDLALRRRAVERVERLGADGMPDAKYLAPLAALLSDGDERTRGLAALALSRHVVAVQERVPEGVVAPLLLGLLDTNPHIAAYCQRVLLALGPLALADVRSATAATQPRRQRLAALEGARHLTTLGPCRDAVNALYWSLLADADGPVRERAHSLLLVLAADYPLPAMTDPATLKAAFATASPRICAMVQARIVSLNDAAFPIVADLLADGKQATRTAAVLVLEALLKSGLTPEATLTPTLLERLERDRLADSAGLRGELAGLIRAQKEAITQVDAALAKVKYAGVFDNRDAFKLIAPIETAATRVLVERLAAQDVATQRAAAALLQPIYHGARVRPTPQALTNLARALRSDDIEVAREVALTVRSLASPERPVPAALLDALRHSLTRDDPTLRVRASLALAACGAQAEAVVLVLLQSRDTEVQFYAAEVVEHMATAHKVALPATEPHLKRLLGSTERDVSRAAVRAIEALRLNTPGGRQ